METSGNAAAAGLTAGLLIVWLLGIGLGILMLVAAWKVLTKAGQPGWACIIPIYNVIVWAEVADKPIWWGLLLFVPGVNVIFSILLSIAIAEQFGEGAGFGIGLWLLPFIFYPMLAFGGAEYQSYNNRPRTPRTV